MRLHPESTPLKSRFQEALLLDQSLATFQKYFLERSFFPNWAVIHQELHLVNIKKTKKVWEKLILDSFLIEKRNQDWRIINFGLHENHE